MCIRDSRYAMLGLVGSSLACAAAVTAPHDSWPMTTSNGIWRCSAPYSTDARIDLSMTSPAVRITKMSPRPTLNTYSGGTRESTHDNTIAYGCCPVASSWRRLTLSETGDE